MRTSPQYAHAKNITYTKHDECKDDHLHDAPQEPATCNNRSDHLQEAEDPKWDVSQCFSISECQEECISPDFLEEKKYSKWDISLCILNSEIILPYSIKKHSEISFEILERNQVLNYEILYEEVDVSFENFQEHSLHGFLKEHFGRVLEELQLEQPCHGKQITENFAGCHDPVEEYMEKFFSHNC